MIDSAAEKVRDTDRMEAKASPHVAPNVGRSAMRRDNTTRSPSGNKDKLIRTRNSASIHLETSGTNRWRTEAFDCRTLIGSKTMCMP